LAAVIKKEHATILIVTARKKDAQRCVTSLRARGIDCFGVSGLQWALQMAKDKLPSIIISEVSLDDGQIGDLYNTCKLDKLLKRTQFLAVVPDNKPDSLRILKGLKLLQVLVGAWDDAEILSQISTIVTEEASTSKFSWSPREGVKKPELLAKFYLGVSHSHKTSTDIFSIPSIPEDKAVPINSFDGTRRGILMPSLWIRYGGHSRAVVCGGQNWFAHSNNKNSRLCDEEIAAKIYSLRARILIIGDFWLGDETHKDALEGFRVEITKVDDLASILKMNSSDLMNLDMICIGSGCLSEFGNSHVNQFLKYCPQAVMMFEGNSDWFWKVPIAGYDDGRRGILHALRLIEAGSQFSRAHGFGFGEPVSQNQQSMLNYSSPANLVEVDERGGYFIMDQKVIDKNFEASLSSEFLNLIDDDLIKVRCRISERGDQQRSNEGQIIRFDYLDQGKSRHSFWEKYEDLLNIYLKEHASC
jgi:hypothetical protein